MKRYVAFLRAINVGGHTVKMDRLKQLFEEMGFSGVSTFIASGNVFFASEDGPATEIEKKIEAGLKAALGYEVATFVRSDAELAAVAAHEPFPKAPKKEGDALHISFLRDKVDAATRERVQAVSKDDDLFDVHERELYWLRRGKLMDSTVDPAELGKAMGKRETTMRNANTVRKMAAKYGQSG